MRRPPRRSHPTAPLYYPTPAPILDADQNAGAIDLDFDQITNTPTDLAGYGILDAYTKAQVDAIVPLTARGDLLTRDALTFVRLGIGSSGTFLKSNGTDPVWAGLTAADIASGTFADARIAQSNVTQHQAALAIASTQLTYSGLTSGQALVASGASSAGFRALTAADIQAGTFAGAAPAVFPSDLAIGGFLDMNNNTAIRMKTSGGSLSGAFTMTTANHLQFGAGLLHAQVHHFAGTSQRIIFFSNNATSILDLDTNAKTLSLTQTGSAIRIAGNQVLSARKTGWTAWTGTATRGSFATNTATLVNVAEALKALIDDLISHGIIGT